MSDDEDKSFNVKISDGRGVVVNLSVLVLVIWLGHCGGLKDIRQQACIYKTGSPECKR